ncbi:uncharacterized protein [Ptychodera flava]|uniref:uncharacterized protein n=1 Tax=Ptychodera flava TaxID=63121 RepID=UPI003969CBED
MHSSWPHIPPSYVRPLVTVQALNSTITLSSEFRLDAKWWCDFLPTWNGTASFLEPNWTLSRDLDLFTDASGTIGCGGYHKGHWFTVTWPTSLTASIAWKEMYPILVACSIWGHSWHGRRILFHCDNQTVVHIWKKGSARCPKIMHLVRGIFYQAAKGNFHVLIAHINGTDNSIADSLSRSQMPRFRTLALEAQAQPTPVPQHLRPLHLICGN